HSGGEIAGAQLGAYQRRGYRPKEHTQELEGVSKVVDAPGRKVGAGIGGVRNHGIAEVDRDHTDHHEQPDRNQAPLAPQPQELGADHLPRDGELPGHPLTSSRRVVISRNRSSKLWRSGSSRLTVTPAATSQELISPA